VEGGREGGRDVAIGGGQGGSGGRRYEHKSSVQSCMQGYLAHLPTLFNSQIAQPGKAWQRLPPSPLEHETALAGLLHGLKFQASY